MGVNLDRFGGSDAWERWCDACDAEYARKTYGRVCGECDHCAKPSDYGFDDGFVGWCTEHEFFVSFTDSVNEFHECLNFSGGDC